jgi:hypothetical protein
VVQPNAGDGQGDKQWELLGTHHVLRVVRGVEANRRLHSLVMWCCHLSAQDLDDALVHNVLGTPIHDMECLATLVGDGVCMVVDGLQHTLGVLEQHLFTLVLLWICQSGFTTLPLALLLE